MKFLYPHHVFMHGARIFHVRVAYAENPGKQ